MFGQVRLVEHDDRRDVARAHYRKIALQEAREKAPAGVEGIAIIKPWETASVVDKIRLAEDAGAFAVGMDIDAAGLATLSLHGKGVSPKTPAEIAAVRKATKLPFILKGVMTIEDALAAADCGVDAIVVSNHGGRVLDGTPGVAEVLPEIAAACKGKITVLADGGVRSGVDVLRMLALGADAVLLGRPLVVASVGGMAEGVKLAYSRLRAELESAMILTGCASLADIDGRVIRR
ncbi:MAG TPA: alpha-hydroxy-acid oxidizing protein [Treponemataceae bacterium]|nr:alpha-hydroxy-acid oxidizing protein [Treponemataceae bacterium]